MIRMKNNKIKQMADKLLPEDLRPILSSVNSDVKWAILSDLLDGDKSFTQLKEDLEIDNKSLAYNLDKLLENGIITHYYKHEFFKQNFSFYQLTNIGKAMIKSIDYIFYIPGSETPPGMIISANVNIEPPEQEIEEIAEFGGKSYTVSHPSTISAPARIISKSIMAGPGRKTRAFANRVMAINSDSNPPKQLKMVSSRRIHFGALKKVRYK